MADTTSVPPVTFGPNGFQVPAESDILAGVIADMNAAFGGGLNPALETPQGQLASSMAAIIGNSNDVLLKYTQQVDPSYAEGRMQDGIARIYFLERKPAQPTVVNANVTGLAGVVIPASSLAVATDGNLYASTGSITIPAGGTVSVQFACTVNGPIACPASSLNTIYQAVPGWDTINNPADGVLGNNTESRADFEFRRSQSVFFNSVGSVPAVRAAVLNVPNVLDAYVVDNPSNGTLSIGSVMLQPHALYVAAVGGDPQAVAQAIWSKKSPGCPYYAGNTSRTVQDTSPGYTAPFPSYVVTYEVPPSLAIKFAVSIANSSNVPSNAAALIQAAIISAFAGGDGGARARIGSVIYASRFYSAIAALGSWVQIISVLIGTTTATLTSVTVSIDQAPAVAAGDIAVTLV